MSFDFCSQQKVAFVCFGCRVARKHVPSFYYQEHPDVFERGGRKRMPGVTCLSCGGEMRFLGRYFKVPPRADEREWRKAEMLWRAGWRADGWTSPAWGMRTLRDARDIEERTDERRQKYLQARRREASREKWRRARRQKHP